MSKFKRTVFGETGYVKVEDKNRFYYMLQQMQANRWRITVIVLFLFFFIIAGINSAVFFSVEIQENWKEMLLILLGAFVGNLNKVVDYWFNSEDRDKMLIQKVDEEDGNSLSNVAEYTSPKTLTSPTSQVSYVPTPSESTVVNEPVQETNTFVEESTTDTYVEEEPIYQEPRDFSGDVTDEEQN